MTKHEFQLLINNRVIFLDGATGSNLQLRGMPAGVCPEKWISENPEVLTGLQKEYVDAGTDILYAPTFTANRIKLAEYGLEKDIRSLIHKLVQASRKAADYGTVHGRKVYIAGDLTMTGQQLAPIGMLDFDELVDVYSEQIRILNEAGVDLLVVETMMSLQECRAALIAAKETCPDLPVMVTMTFEAEGRSLYGTDAKTAAVVLESLGADAIGANCSTGPKQMAKVIREMSSVTRIPIIAKPNAGLPVLKDGKTVYNMQPEEFAEQSEYVYQAGASVFGGCCGTTPAHIKKLHSLLCERKTADVCRRPDGRRYLTSERCTLEFDQDSPVMIVGERINPTGKQELQEDLLDGFTDTVLEFAEEQEEDGASVLDINIGMSGIDEKAMMLQVLEDISTVTQLPLSIDSSDPEVLEAAMRRYPGRALINSVSLESGKTEKLLPLIKKYGAMFIAMPVSDNGLPRSFEERIVIIEKLVKQALASGLKKEDILVDCLVQPVAVEPSAASDALSAIRFCREQDLATVIGLSNISFLMPERSNVNSTFLTMAAEAGLNMAIANPSQNEVMNCLHNANLLMQRTER